MQIEKKRLWGSPLVEVLVGAGGWAYFNVSGDRLRGYAKAFRMVEVNSTFYRIPPLSLVRSWRRRVPEDFKFTVRCHREITRRLQSNNKIKNFIYSKIFIVEVDN